VHKGFNSVVWNWLKGPTITKLDFGNPQTTNITLCVYDYAAGVPHLAATATVPANSTCSGGPCWLEGKVGFRFRDRNASYDGIRSIVMRAGDVSKIAFKSKGSTVPLPTLPLVRAPKVTVQLQRADNPTKCWGADYTASVRNLNFIYKAKNF
jgi:hypothetical protein